MRNYSWGILISTEHDSYTCSTSDAARSTYIQGHGFIYNKNFMSRSLGFQIIYHCPFNWFCSQWSVQQYQIKLNHFTSIATSLGGKTIEKPHPKNVGDIMQKNSCWSDSVKVILMNFTIFCVITMKFLITVLNLFIG